MKVDLIFTTPLAFLMNYIVTNASLVDEGDNMTCFKDPYRYN